MHQRYEPSGSVSAFGRMAVELDGRGDVHGLLVLACDGNGWTREEVDPVLSGLRTPVFGGIFPQVIFDGLNRERGTLVVTLPVHPRIAVIGGLSGPARETGMGIPAGRVGDLFQSFTQVDASTTRRYGGSGLGLAISRELVELMGGRIGVESREGEGSEFWFTLPLRVGAEVPGAPLDMDLDGVRILVVDDNRTNRDLALILLERWGGRAEAVPGGPEALERLGEAVVEGDPFQVALLDMQMPDMDGADLARAIRRDPRLGELALIMLTSLARKGDAAFFQRLGFSGYLTKPYRAGDLRDILSATLGRTRQQISDQGEAGSEVGIATRHSVREWRRSLRGWVLLVEDNPINREVAVHILRELGLEVDTAENGAEAVKAAHSRPYDLILMDCQMPIMDGYAATRAIRSGEARSGISSAGAHPGGNGAGGDAVRRLPIVAMTANVMRGDRERCPESGMDDYVAKPVEPRRLAAVLRKWLPSNL